MKFRLTIPTAVKATQKVCAIQSLLDHGTGQGGLISTLTQDKSLQINAQGYDPGVPIFSKIPTSKYDIVTSIDVLEHIGKSWNSGVVTLCIDLKALILCECADKAPLACSMVQERLNGAYVLSGFYGCGDG